MSESHSEVLVDHERNVSPFKKSILGLTLCSSRLTPFLKQEFGMTFFTAEAIIMSSISKFGKRCPCTDREDVRSSSALTISTYLIHNIASKSDPDFGLESYFPKTREWKT